MTGSMKKNENLMRTETYYQLLPAFLQEHGRKVGEYAQRLVNYTIETHGVNFFPEADRSLLKEVYQIGRYHDVGKAAITGKIWLNSGNLDGAEQVLMRTHTVFGAFIVRSTVVLPEQEPRTGDFWEVAAQCCEYHHERWDGSGYPFGISGEQIPCFARIISIADAYDAMTAERPYHKGISRRAALKRIARGAGSQFDPVFADLFCESM